MKSGIYSILNNNTGKIYIGQSKDINRRFNDHKRELVKNIHSNHYLQSSWNKYGESTFSFNVLEYCPISCLNESEVWWIDFFESMDRTKGFNLKSGGNSNIVFSDETIKKMRETQSRIKTWSGRHHTDETKKKISKSKKGVKFSETHKKNISLHHADQSGVNNGCWGTSLIEYYGGLDFLLKAIKDGKSQQEVANQIGITRSTIQDYLKCRGLKWSEVKGDSEKYKKNITSIINSYGGLWFLKMMASTDISIKYVASCLGVDESSVRRYLKQQYNTNWTLLKREVIV